jgi:nucleoside-diphosphate-sugar epimerase
MRILVTGLSGFVGAALAPRLIGEGHSVRGLARNRARAAAALATQERIEAATAVGQARTATTTTAMTMATEAPTGLAAAIEIVEGDVLTGGGLARALADVEVAYYLIHSMEHGGANRTGARGTGETSFAERERVGALNFATAAAEAGVRRIVYLGGPLPADRARASPHLASRQAVEEVLLEYVPDSVALRAAIVIGARSRSFRLLVRLVERLPALVLPPWRRFRLRPIDERDALAMLTAAAGAGVSPGAGARAGAGAGARAGAAGGGVLDIGGPESVTYGELIERIAELMLVSRPAFALGVGVTPIAASIAAAIAGEDRELIAALMVGLQADLLPDTDRAARVLGVQLHSVDAAIEHALREWEALEPLAAR